MTVSWFGGKRIFPRGTCATVAVLGTLLAVSSISCSTTGRQTRLWNEPEVELVWPLPPERPRIAYVGSISSGEDLGDRGGFMQRLAGLVVGNHPRNMVKPIAVAKNSNGLLAVADPAIPTVHFLDVTGQRYTRLKGNLSSRLRSPVGIAVASDGRVYVADSILAEVLVFDDPAHQSATFGSGTLKRPTGLALSPDQTLLYVVDTMANQVVVYDRHTGEERQRFGHRGTGVGDLNFPTYIAVAPDGRLLVSDSLNFRAQWFSPEGKPLESLGKPGNAAGDFARPKGVAIDRRGYVFIVDTAFENVQIFDSHGALLMALGSAGSGPGQFTLPTDIWVDPVDDTIWVADSFNQRIEVFRLLGNKP